MMTHRESPESWIRHRTTRDRMTEVEARLAWTEIQTRFLRESEAVAPAPSGRSFMRRRLASLAVAGALATTALLGYALLPVGSDPGSSSGVVSSNLESASAAELLQTAAEITSTQHSLMPAAGELLFWQTSSDRPSDGPTGYPRTVREWIDSDGRGRRVETINGGFRDRDRTLTQFTAERPDPSIELGESWRALFGISQLADLPDTPERLLGTLRDRVEAAVGQNAYLGEGKAKLLGVDFITLISTVQLLGQAPLDSDQRGALFEVLMNAPEWIRSGAAPVSIDNLGTVTTDGRTGNRLRIAMDIEGNQAGNTGTAPGTWQLDLIVDPEAGELISTHEYDSGDVEPQITTIHNLEVIPAP